MSEQKKQEERERQTEAPALEVDTLQKAVISMDTEYHLQIYNSGSDQVEEERLAVPAELIGKNREEVGEHLSNYMKDIPLEEYLDGLLSYEIVSFSEDKVVLRKTYRQDLMIDKFFITSEDDQVVVYYSDKKTVYDYTGIDSSHLSPEERLKLNIGYTVRDQEELYGILENYSS